MSLTVVHVIARLDGGGPSRVLAATIRHAPDSRIMHRIVSLERTAPQSTSVLPQNGLRVVEQPEPAALRRELDHADIVQVHFWNTPELYEVLRARLPAMRLLLSSRIGGRHPPHVLTEEVVGFADLTIASTSYTEELPAFRDAARMTAMIPATGGWERLLGVRPRPHRSFNIGYVGTVEFTKMHPRIVQMSACVDVPNPRFIVCGTGDGFGALAREATALGMRDRFDLLGYVDDVGSVLGQLDVFGYPLCKGNYSATDLVLQEAMYCGVPPVVLPHGGAQCSVSHGRTGLIAENEDGYVRALEGLYRDPDERRRLGRAAAADARARWDPRLLATRWSEMYEWLAAEPKRTRRWPEPPAIAGGRTSPAAAHFVQSLGGTAPEFEISLRENEVDVLLDAEACIARCTPVLASADAGGVLHWRRRHPDDPWLRLWAGLVLRGQGRPALAAGEFASAIRLGVEHPRARDYLAGAVAEAEAVAA